MKLTGSALSLYKGRHAYEDSMQTSYDNDCRLLLLLLLPKGKKKKKKEKKRSKHHPQIDCLSVCPVIVEFIGLIELHWSN